MTSTTKSSPDEIMIVNDVPGEECRIAILEDGHLEELYAERVATATKVGNIYKGRVVNVEPAIQAAFVDYGESANGFLHISDLHPRYFPGAERVERVGRKIPRRERPPIQAALKRGNEVLVQVLKEGIGTKGPTLTSYLSIPGRLLVMMPDMDRVGVSRKLEDEEDRREMRKILDGLDLPDGFGFILRTAGVGRTKTELKRDVAYVTRLWKVMAKRIERIGAPCALYTESDVLIRTVRDVLRPSIQAIVVDSESAFDRMTTFLSVITPRSAPRVIRYRRSVPIFHAFDVERQIELIHGREVPLRSGGRLVIDQTEALVAIDVNSGKSRRARDSETNAYQTNCEAVDEISRQLRLRDLGGLIIHDLIDMRQAKHRRLVEDRFRENLKRDRARSTILRISDFGLIEMTRQRMRPDMRKTHFMTCPHCEGHGEIKAPASVAADVTRHVAYLLDQDRVRRIEISCSPRVASVLLSRKRRELVELEDRDGQRIDVRVVDEFTVDRVEYYAYDDRQADIDISRLPAVKLPSLKALEADEVAPGSGQAESGTDGTRRRRRRRRGGGPADATAIALAGGFDESEVAASGDSDEDEDEDGSPEAVEETAASAKRPRRRRRRRKSGAAETAPAESSPVESDAPAGPSGPADDGKLPARPMRVHELARALGVASREILDRCRAQADIEVNNHMSSLSPEAVTIITRLFRPVGAEEQTGVEESEDRPARKRRRRRRGGRGRKGRSGTSTTPATDEAPGETAGDERAADPDGDEVEAGVQPAAEVAEPPVDEPHAGEVAREKTSRRSRRGGRGRRKKSVAVESDAVAPEPGEAGEPVAAGAESEPSAEAGSDERPATKKKRSRSGQRRTKPTSEGEADEGGPPQVSVTAASSSALPAPPRKRRSLYGSRRPLGPVQRDTASEAVER